VLDKELREITSLGVRVRTNTRVGTDIALDELLQEYDACLMATGAWQSKTLPIPGADRALLGLPFLTQIAAGTPPPLGKRVVVIGSGGTAFDCASSALCLGVPEVHIACLEGPDQMLATPDEIARGREEGVILHNGQSFTKILSTDGRVFGIECQDVRSFSFDDTGRLQLEVVPASEHVIPADTVICAVGQVPDLACVSACGVTVTRHPTLAVDPKTGQTSRAGLFAAGDAATGSKSIVEAIGGGRTAAIAIHRYLTMRDSKEQIRSVTLAPDGTLAIETAQYTPDEALPQRVVQFEHLANVAFFEKKPRIPMKSVPFPASIQPGCGELHAGYTKPEAIEEAERCFHCGHCFQCRTCVEVCPEDVFVMGEDGAIVAYPDECYTCGSCVMDCPCSAITMRIPAPMRLATVTDVRL
jgi:thioredoxin reductase/NAD-dependent dihydropyrimidine dehydrogenase PreA subunit